LRHPQEGGDHYSQGYAVGKKDSGIETVLGGHTGFFFFRQVLSYNDYFIVRLE
jgi:hypothetical protein